MRLPPGLLAPPIAHRGLWRAPDAPENTLPAIELACRSGYGIEFDVRMSRDGEAVVFHDDTLERLAGVPASVWDLTVEELQSFPLPGGQRIPTLAQALGQVAGRVMLLVEIKAGQDGDGRLEARIGELLGRYAGAAAVISFDPSALAWFALNHPEWPRGLDALGLSEEEAAEAEETEEDVEALFEAKCAIAAPHFLVLESRSARSAIARRHREAGRPVIAWTVRSPEEAAALAGTADNIIFEGFTA